MQVTKKMPKKKQDKHSRVKVRGDPAHRGTGCGLASTGSLWCYGGCTDRVYGGVVLCRGLHRLPAAAHVEAASCSVHRIKSRAVVQRGGVGGSVAGRSGFKCIASPRAAHFPASHSTLTHPPPLPPPPADVHQDRQLQPPHAHPLHPRRRPEADRHPRCA